MHARRAGHQIRSRRSTNPSERSSQQRGVGRRGVPGSPGASVCLLSHKTHVAVVLSVGCGGCEAARHDLGWIFLGPNELLCNLRIRTGQEQPWFLRFGGRQGR
jgi:hypothetical protein